MQEKISTRLFYAVLFPLFLILFMSLGLLYFYYDGAVEMTCLWNAGIIFLVLFILLVVVLIPIFKLIKIHENKKSHLNKCKKKNLMRINEIKQEIQLGDKELKKRLAKVQGKKRWSDIETDYLKNHRDERKKEISRLNKEISKMQVPKPNAVYKIAAKIFS